MENFSHYKRKFLHLNTATVDNVKAPHKPILLLSIIQSLEHREIKENKIYITPQLVARFKDNWHRLVDNPRFTANFSLPFYHLKSDKFWHLKTFLGIEILLISSNSIRSFSHLKDVVDYTYLNEDLFELLITHNGREELKETLLQKYFHLKLYSLTEQLSLVAEIENQMLKEAPAIYKKQAETFDEEDVFIRSGVFKKIVPQIYNYSCCVSGMRIIASKEIQMIDACHIVPFSESHDDTISNGISLCPNLHRAFDRGLIAIDNDYCVVVSNAFNESSQDYLIKKFDGKPIVLPTQTEMYPSLNNLRWHRTNRYIF